MDNDIFFKTLQRLIKWRYLDSLDSIRFSEENDITKRMIHARSLIYLTLLMGHGIVVPNNQLMDSIGFIRYASELIKLYENNDHEFFLPIKFAYWGPNSAFEVTANAFDKIKSNDDPYRFILSSWPSLDTDFTRRKKWVDAIRDKRPIPENIIEFQSEDRRAKELFRVLDYFDRNEYTKCPAGKTKDLRVTLIKEIIEISPQERERIFINFDDDKIKMVNNIITVLNNLDKLGINLDVRSDIKNALNTREKEAFVNTPDFFINDIRIGVMKVVDSVYTYTSYIATNASQDDHTEEMGPIFKSNLGETNNKISELEQEVETWGYEEAAYFLATWVRQKYSRPFRNPNDIISLHDFYFNHKFSKKELEIQLERLSWDQMVAVQESPVWRSSVLKYLEALRDYDDIIEKLSTYPNNDLSKDDERKKDDVMKKYDERRKEHLEFIKLNILSSQEHIETGITGEDTYVLLEKSRPVISSTTENYAKNKGEDQEITSLQYSKKSSKNIDVKGITSELRKDTA